MDLITYPCIYVMLIQPISASKRGIPDKSFEALLNKYKGAENEQSSN